MTHDEFRKAIEDYLTATRLAPGTFGKSALSDPNFVFDVRRGRRPNLDTVEIVMKFMANHPTGLGKSAAA